MRGHRFGRQHTPADFTYPLLPNTAGLVIGKRGATIQRLQRECSLRRVVYVKERNAVDAWGSTSACAELSQKLEGLMHDSVTRKHIKPKFSLVLFDCAPDDTLKFSTVHSGALCQWLSNAHADESCWSTYEVEQASDSVDALSAIRSLSLDPEGDIFIAGHQSSMWTPQLQASLQNLQLADPDLELSIELRFGMQFFSGRGEYRGPNWRLPCQQLPSFKYGKDVSMQFSGTGFEDQQIVNLRRVLALAGYEKLPITRTIAVHLLDMETKKAYSITLLPKESKQHVDEISTLINQILASLNYFQALGIKKAADSRKIKLAYRRLALKVHPDKTTHPAAEAAFKIINEAYQCLQDDQKCRDHKHQQMSTPLGQKHGVSGNLPDEQPRPSVVKVSHQQRRLGLVSFVSPGTRKAGYRISVTSEAKEVDLDQGESTSALGGAGSLELRSLMARAWDNRDADGMLVFPNGRRFATGLVQHKTKEAYSNGETRVQIQKVKVAGESREGTVDGQHWDVSISSFYLEEKQSILTAACGSVSSPTDRARAARAVVSELARIVQEANGLAASLSLDG